LPTTILRTVEDTTAAGRRLGALLRPGDVVGLEGPLGVGKTTWIRGLAEGLGVDAGYGVTSPTFVYAHIYPGKVPLHHLDFYRLETETRLYAAGLEELIGGEAVTVIEWYNRYPRVWDGDLLTIRMDFDSSGARRVELEARGSRPLQTKENWEKSS
jgi:tRNA threonylcarbamoyladenosine biosynthesis protein TsaE